MRGIKDRVDPFTLYPGRKLLAGSPTADPHRDAKVQ
jgi:hypothetical protein